MIGTTHPRLTPVAAPVVVAGSREALDEVGSFARGVLQGTLGRELGDQAWGDLPALEALVAYKGGRPQRLVTWALRWVEGVPDA